MAEQKNPQAQPELSLSEQTRIRREKLTNLQAEGQFILTSGIFAEILSNAAKATDL